MPHLKKDNKKISSNALKYKIKEHMELNNISIPELGRYLGKCDRMVHNYINSPTNFPIETLRKIYVKCHIPKEEFVTCLMDCFTR